VRDAGTLLVEDLTGDSASANPRFITLVGDRLFAVADSNVFGSETWSGTLGSLQGDTLHGAGILNAIWEREFMSRRY
jgi:hypothetical protein